MFEDKGFLDVLGREGRKIGGRSQESNLPGTAGGTHRI